MNSMRRGSRVDTDMSFSSDAEDFDLENATKYEEKLNDYQRKRETNIRSTNMPNGKF